MISYRLARPSQGMSFSKPSPVLSVLRVEFSPVSTPGPSAPTVAGVGVGGLLPQALTYSSPEFRASLRCREWFA